MLFSVLVSILKYMKLMRILFGVQYMTKCMRMELVLGKKTNTDNDWNMVGNVFFKCEILYKTLPSPRYMTW